MLLRFSDRLKRLIRYWRASGTRCFRWRMLMSSGPVELFVFDILIAFATCCVVSFIGVEVSLWVCRSFLRLIFLDECFDVFTNCFVKAFAFCFAEDAGLLLKEMILFGCVGGFLLFSWLILLQ